MTLLSRIEQRMRLTKRQLATLDELELHLAEQERIGDVYKTVESDLSLLGYESTVWEKTGENIFRDYHHKEQPLQLEAETYQRLAKLPVNRSGTCVYPLMGTSLVGSALLGIINVNSRHDHVLLQEYAKGIGIELSPRYYRKQKERTVKERLRQVDELMSDAMHDLRSRLTPLRGYASLLSPRMSADPQAGKILEHLHKILDKAEGELNYFQRVFREGRQEKVPTNLYQLMERVMEEQRPIVLHQQQIDLINNLPIDDVVSVEGPAMELALYELVHNAIKYSPAGSQVTARSEIGEKQLKLYLRNTGVQLTDEKLTHLFDHQHAQGTGLGLSFVRRVILEHGGKLCAYSDGNAVQFEITLPYP